MSTAIAATVPATASPQASSGSFASEAGIEDFSFHDLLSIVNPLQHLPIVATVYRALTGDTIRPLERIAGDSLYGGFWGFVSSVANVTYQEITGKDFGETALAFLEGDDDQPTALASNNSTSSTSQAAPSSSAPTDAATNSSIEIAAADTAIANGPPRSLLNSSMTAPASASSNDAATLALMSSLNTKGIDGELGQRALAAYRRSLAASSADSVPAF